MAETSPEPQKVELPTLEEFERASAAIRPPVVHTPLVPLSPELTPREGDGACDIRLKLETFQPISSFKLRGIFHAVASLSPDERAAGLSTVSAGNTAQALAWAGRHFGVEARSRMPQSAPTTKIRAVERYGGRPILVSVDELFRFLQEHLWEDEPYAFIHPWTNRDVMIGHGSLGLELLEDCPDAASVYLPVGGGGLFAGVAAALARKRPDLRVVAVEPSGCPALRASLDAGRPVQVDCKTICDGVAVPYMTEEMYPYLEQLADDVILIDEPTVERWVRDLALVQKIVTEPSGVLAVAAAAIDPNAPPGPRVAVVTGGSIDGEKLAALLTSEDV